MVDEGKIYEIMAKRAYSREEPYLETKIKERIHHFVSLNEPIKFLGFWGIGNKLKPNWADRTTCEYLTKMNTEIKNIYSPGIEFTFIFATFHGIHNGISIENINSYTGKIEKLFNEFHFKFIYLDLLWKKYGINFKKIDTILAEKKENRRNDIENREIIEHSAQERNQRLSPEIAAQKYYIMRNLEKEMLEKEFSDYIFHAFSYSKFRNVLPELPTLYLFSIKKRRSDAPWFITEDK